MSFVTVIVCYRLFLVEFLGIIHLSIRFLSFKKKIGELFVVFERDGFGKIF